MEIWDGHCHLAGALGATPRERASELLRYADRLGIARLIVFMGMGFSHEPTPEVFRKQNDEALAAMGHAPDRIMGYAYVNPNFVEESLAEMERCIAEGPMVGIKLWVAARARAESLDPIIERATELDAAVFQHTWMKITGNLPGESTPEDLVILAKRHPKAKFICGHTGGDWEQGIRAIRNSPNVCAELAGGDPVSGITEMAVRELGAERVIYGSDAAGRSFSTQLGKVAGARISERDKELILAENLKRLLEPILSRKEVAR